MSEHRLVIPFVGPAVSMGCWGASFAAAMVAGHSVGWLCLVPFVMATWRFLRGLEVSVAAWVRRQAALNKAKGMP